MGTFAMYADWRLDGDTDDEAVVAGSNAIEIEDPDACVWRDEHDRRAAVRPAESPEQA